MSKKLIQSIFSLTLFILLFAFQSQSNGEGDGKLSKKLVKKIKKEQVYLVDVRTPEEYNTGHFKYSKNVDYKSGSFNKQISQLDKNKPVYLYCRTGNRSSKAADSLKALGFKVYYNIGGFEELKKTGFPVE